MIFVVGKMLSLMSPTAVDFKKLKLKPKNIFERSENVNIAIKIAVGLGIRVVNIGAQDIIEGR